MGSAATAPDLPGATMFSQRLRQGFSRTAGLNYPLDSPTAPIPEGNVPLDTGIVPLGGIPLLDEQVRPALYQQGGPVAVNATAEFNAPAQGDVLETATTRITGR